jgi:hypothetical protein
MPYRALAGWPPERQTAILAEADGFLHRLEEHVMDKGLPIDGR